MPMFSWVCPKCSREVSSAKAECPFCTSPVQAPPEPSAKPNQWQAHVPPQYQQQPPQPGPNQWQAQVPPQYQQAPAQGRTITYFIDAITKHYADFSGRASKTEYGMYVLFNFLAALVVRFFEAGFSDRSLLSASLDPGLLSTMLTIGLFLPGCAVMTRRLHDVGKSGWFWLLVLIPIVGWIWLLVLLCTEGDPGSNQYGPNPKLADMDNSYPTQTVQWQQPPVATGPDQWQQPPAPPVPNQWQQHPAQPVATVPTSPNRFCGKCGTSVPGDSVFCGACGVRVQ